MDEGGGGGAASSADAEAAAEALRALCNLCQTFPPQQGLAQGARRQEKRHEKADWAVAAGVVRPLIRIAETRPALADLVRSGGLWSPALHFLNPPLCILHPILA